MTHLLDLPLVCPSASSTDPLRGIDLDAEPILSGGGQERESDEHMR